MPIALDIRLPPESVSAREARARIAHLEASIGSDALDDVSLLVSELVTNSVRHARLEDDQAIEVSILVDDVVRVDVREPGPGFREPSGGRADPLRSSGWGLFLVDRLADRWGIDRARGTDVWFEIRLGRVCASPGAGSARTNSERRLEMGDKLDEAKGRAKEAAGDLTNDDQLKREGKMDRAGATVKEKTGEAVDKAKDKVNEVLEKD